MGNKRVKLDLSNIFNDYRKKAIVSLRPEWKNVEAFQNHIINLFGLEHHIYLTNLDGFVIPAAEHTLVIDHDEVLVVHKITLEALLAPNPIPNGKTSQSKNIQNGTSSESSDAEIGVVKAQVSQKLDQIRDVPPSALDDVRIKRRRKRVRKRKRNDEPQPSTSKQETKISPTPLWSKNPKNVHVRFTDASTSSSEDDTSQPPKMCKFANGETVTSKKIQPIIRHWNPQTQSYQLESLPESSIRVESEASRPPNLEISPPTTTQPVIGPILPEIPNKTDDLSEAEVPEAAIAQTPTTTLPAGPSTDTLEELRKEISQLNLPEVKYESLKISDTIAFKLLRMDDQCQPTISDYIIGCIEKINKEKEEITIRLLAGKSEIGSRICMTVITAENEIGMMEEDHIDVTFKELYEPRFCLISM